ncbi:meiotic recombination protein DMC1/LIM15 homolog [Anthonomus grandis grandis]|uniref:meiotic recombination protein DMC1/LIM15 homolog n=1 Tax=Anthonomus grandis grandis TaxID=2921223 RepID=UPI002166B624|nr:meiotic recombination protein DMC1/LIM15 homolog [Anthonomus grandis grandis]
MAQMAEKPREIVEKQIEEVQKVVAVSEVSSDERTEAEESVLNSEEEDVGFLDIDLLLDHGISLKEVNQLKKAGFNTVKGIQMATQKKLSMINGFNEAQVIKIKEACKKIAQIGSATSSFINCLELSEQRKQVFRLSTGSKNIDKILGGGVESMSLTEVFGEARTGKTQLAHTLCVTAQMPGENGYLGGKVIVIDTESTFRPDRIKPIADRFDLDNTSVLENICYARAYNSEHQYELLNGVAEKLHEEPGMFKLLIVDSIMALFRVDFIGSGEMSERQSKLGLMLSRLQKISEEYNIAVFLTNQITTDLNFTLLNDLEVKPVGGNILAHTSTTRIALKKGKGNIRIAKLYDSPNLEEKETEFLITNGGIADPKSDDE